MQEIQQQLIQLRAEVRKLPDKWEARLWSGFHLTLAAAILAAVLVRL